ncbi:hypothetical protein [Streptomyces sp. C10-9-1]|uniref:hypothetical protein n=1 Tax=Streptomyces sp. C10-9-1 TaxID=1859285 RepID=UPI003D7349AB
MVALACLGILGIAVFLLVRLVRVNRSAKELQVPLGPKAAFWGAIAYFLPSSRTVALLHRFERLAACRERRTELHGVLASLS